MKLNSKEHFLNMSLVEKYGALEAIVIQHLQYWINVNIKNDLKKTTATILKTANIGCINH